LPTEPCYYLIIKTSRSQTNCRYTLNRQECRYRVPLHRR